jgi:hypothetical protein
MRTQEHRLELSLQAKLQLKAAGWRPPLLVTQARSRAKWQEIQRALLQVNSAVKVKLLATAAD